MKKLYALISFLIMAALFNLLCFMTRDIYTDSFYVSVAFGNGSLLLGLLVETFGSMKKKREFMSYSYYAIITVYQIVAIAANLLFVWFGLESVRANILINCVITGVSLLLVFWLLAGDADSAKQAKEHTKKLNYNYDMRDAVRPLLDRGSSIRANKRLEAFYEAVANSQLNVDREDLYEKDQAILEEARRIDRMLVEGVDEEQLIRSVNKAISLVDARNEYVKNSYMRGV